MNKGPLSLSLSLSLPKRIGLTGNIYFLFFVFFISDTCMSHESLNNSLDGQLTEGAIWHIPKSLSPKLGKNKVLRD
jgi:hypothetical protein